MERIPITQEGYDNVKSEIQRMETVEMPLIAQKIADARAEGDLSENAEYHGQRENQGMLQAKIDRLKAKLALSYIVEPNDAPKDSIVFGCTVTLKDTEADLEESYQLIGPGEEDYSGEIIKILCDSPLAKQMLHHKVGDKLKVETPGGIIHYEILTIE